MREEDKTVFIAYWREERGKIAEILERHYDQYRGVIPPYDGGYISEALKKFENELKDLEITIRKLEAEIVK